MLQQFACSTARKSSVVVGNVPGGCVGSGALAPGPEAPNLAIKRTRQSERLGSRIAKALDCSAARRRIELTDSSNPLCSVSSALELARSDRSRDSFNSSLQWARLLLLLLDQSIASRTIKDRAR